LTRFKFFRREIPVSPRARDRWLEAAVLGGLIGLFLAVAAVFPVVPGMIPESHVENVKLSLRVMQLLQEQSLWTLFIEGKLPASWSPSQPYQGALMAYLYLPVFYLVGANLAIAEYWHFLFVVPTLALVYFLMKQMFGRAAGMLAVLFLVVHPGYVAGTRLGVYFLGYLHFFSVGSLYFLYRWRQTGRTAYFCLGFLLLGMGMSLLSIFYWYVAALAAAALLYRSEFFGQGALRAVKLAGAGLAAAAAGAALNIYQ
jgi:membrane-associated HD superfamily phosphohydrolase